MKTIHERAMEMFDEEILYSSGDRTRHNCMSTSDEQELKSFISQIIDLAQKEKEEEYKQFILNLLDEVDVADELMGNIGGGTKALRHAIQSRLIT